MEVDQVFPRVEIDLWNTQKSMPSQGDPKDKLICIQSVAQVSTVNIMEHGTVQHGTGYISNKSKVLLYLPYLHCLGGLCENTRLRDNDYNNTNMPESVMVFTIATTLSKEL